MWLLLGDNFRLRHNSPQGTLLKLLPWFLTSLNPYSHTLDSASETQTTRGTLKGGVGNIVSRIECVVAAVTSVLSESCPQLPAFYRTRPQGTLLSLLPWILESLNPYPSTPDLIPEPHP